MFFEGHRWPCLKAHSRASIARRTSIGMSLHAARDLARLLTERIREVLPLPFLLLKFIGDAQGNRPSRTVDLASAIRQRQLGRAI
jgi:hypothetical protein